MLFNILLLLKFEIKNVNKKTSNPCSEPNKFIDFIITINIKLFITKSLHFS